MRKDGRKMLLQPRDFNVNRSKYLFSHEKEFFYKEQLALCFLFFFSIFFFSFSIYLYYLCEDIKKHFIRIQLGIVMFNFCEHYIDT